MTWILKTTTTMMQTLGPALSEFYGTNLSITDEFIELINMIIMLSAICMGIVTAKVTSFTIKNTLSVIISIIISIAAILLMPYLPAFVPEVNV
ncbi:MAG: hypothetical protein D6752_00075 [Candidatus Nitrosothermus koennekii]|nr:MAG: hypothetical protein D6752_00075 [Candidatus Nitrosothermus koennekii]